VFWVDGVGLFAKIVPVGFGHFDTVMFGCSFDVGEGLFALVVGDILDLVETGDGVADVRGVVERLFALFGKGVNGGRKIVALLGVEGFVVLVVFPCCFHVVLQVCSSLPLDRVYVTGVGWGDVATAL
jgi:hypothetical protein